jgi:hypothetical protein
MKPEFARSKKDFFGGVGSFVGAALSERMLAEDIATGWRELEMMLFNGRRIEKLTKPGDFCRCRDESVSGEVAMK